ncbi:protein of unknown function [Candidatus Nitrosocosmicus franklandus]|uniref:Uncharacterized protein n=1 Tax=Candidatus Nitrosocosmicus franklandianus TaxID=1798806 RepID=A0A484IFW2_9ARCH|nr:protein of unknown function [Candidatus Nitrosocosmicus franklandus]
MTINYPINNYVNPFIKTITNSTYSVSEHEILDILSDI